VVSDNEMKDNANLIQCVVIKVRSNDKFVYGRLDNRKILLSDKKRRVKYHTHRFALYARFWLWRYLGRLGILVECFLPCVHVCSGFLMK
jgi:hypothetical protein